MRKKAFGLALILLLVAVWLSPVGRTAICSVRLKDSLTFEMPETGGPLREYRVQISDATHGCGEVSVRSGPTSEDAIVTCCGGDRYNITASFRLVYIDTADS